jgi:peptidoglycan/xylan/chitin deacetylase (PgdA/CDA1 family)
MTLRRVARTLRAQAYDRSGLNARARLRLDGTRAAVLYYHRVLPHRAAQDDAVEPGMYVTPESFAKQLDWLTAHFEVIPLHEVVDRLSRAAPLPRGACAISFDDGWRDNFEFALPQLKARGLPATVFVVTERIATRGAFWPDEVSRRWSSADPARRSSWCESAGLDPTVGLESMLDWLKSLREAERAEVLEAILDAGSQAGSERRELLDWDEIDRLSSAGISVESHGATHAILTGIDEPEAADELRRSRAQLRERGHGRHGLLAYPSGGWNRRVAQLAADHGYRAAFSTERGLAGPGNDPFALPRLGLHEDISSTRAEFLFRVPGTL